MLYAPFASVVLLLVLLLLPLLLLLTSARLCAQRICDDVAAFVDTSVFIVLSLMRKVFNCVAFASASPPSLPMHTATMSFLVLVLLLHTNNAVHAT